MNLSNWVTAVGTLLQGIAVAVGVWLAANEFIIKDREAERVRYATTLEVLERDRSEPIVTARQTISAAVYNSARTYFLNPDDIPIGIWSGLNDQFSILTRHYTVLNHCLEAQLCDPKLLHVLACPEARSTHYVLGMDKPPPSGFLRSLRWIAPLHQFVNSCPEGPIKRGLPPLNTLKDFTPSQQ